MKLEIFLEQLLFLRLNISKEEISNKSLFEYTLEPLLLLEIKVLLNTNSKSTISLLVEELEFYKLKDLFLYVWFNKIIETNSEDGYDTLITFGMYDTNRICLNLASGRITLNDYSSFEEEAVWAIDQEHFLDILLLFANYSYNKCFGIEVDKIELVKQLIEKSGVPDSRNLYNGLFEI
jgi:hypothetical protein